MKPDHYAVAAAARQDYPAFAAVEAAMRRRFRYPPFVRLTSLVVSARSLRESRGGSLRPRPQHRHSGRSRIDRNRRSGARSGAAAGGVLALADARQGGARGAPGAAAAPPAPPGVPGACPRTHDQRRSLGNVPPRSIAGAKERRTLPRVKPLARAWRAARNARKPSANYSFVTGPRHGPFALRMACDSRVAFRIPCARHGEGRPHQSGDGGDGFVGPGRPRCRGGIVRGPAGGFGDREARRSATVRSFPRRAPQDRGGAQPANRRTRRYPAGAGGPLPSRTESPQHFVAPAFRRRARFSRARSVRAACRA